jgi:hypothetical protein
MSLMLQRGLWLLTLLVLVCSGCGKVPLPGGAKVVPPPPVRPVAPPVVVREEPPPEAAPDSPSPAKNDVPELTPLEAAPHDAASPTILHEDSFADLKGSIHWNRNGLKSFEGPLTQRTVYFFAATPEGGSYVMQVLEDGTTVGPDGEPGVLALSWQEVPPMLAWSGFVYLGGVGPKRGMKLPALQQARTVDDLANMRLRFRHRAVNPNSDKPVKVMIDCRLEPGLGDSFNKRVGLGKIAATDEWGTFEIALSEGKNLPAFLKMLAEENPDHFKIVFGQEGPILGYRAGDTILIDDLTITHGAPEEKSGEVE